MNVTRVIITICQVIMLTWSVLVRSEEDTCPAPFTAHSNHVCLYYSNEFYEYCDAHLYCYQLGEQVGGRGFIAGKYYKDLTSTAYTYSWTGLHRLSSDVAVGMTSWSMADPYSISKVVEEDKLMNILNDLPPSEERILTMGFTYMHTLVDMYGMSKHVMCQVSVKENAKADPTAVELFKRDPTSETHLSSERVHGCSEVGTAVSHMACAMRCKLNRACRSFAYHPDAKACVLQKYIHSKLNNDVEPKDGKWERFVRPDW